MIDIPGIYVGRFKTNPNNRPALMTRAATPTYTDDNWVNVESTGTIWRYSSEAGEWIDTGLEEILVEEVSGTKEIVAEGTVPWKLQGLNAYGKSTQASTTGAQLVNAQREETFTTIKSFLVSGQPGTYTVSAIVASEEALDGLFQVAFMFDDTLVANSHLKGGTFSSVSLEVPAQFDTVILYSSYDYPDSEGKKVTWKDFMLNAGSTALPWEPYTGGKPSPSPDYPQEIVTAGSDGTIDIAVANSDGTESQTLTFNTPNGLPGIPVDSGGNFTDADGQQWVCDEVDFERGVYVKRIAQVEYDGSSDESWALGTNTNTQRTYFWIRVEKTAFRGSDNDDDTVLLCSAFPYMNYGYAEIAGDNTASFTSTNTFFACSTSLFDTLDEWKQYLTENGMTLVYVIATPIETPLSAEELAAYAALMSYDGSTVISTDEDVSGISAKVVTDVISKNAWFDPYAELALYYKALAGFASLEDLPMPHSRESSLVRKLLDSSYELGFTVTENSSRNERYLWDLVNGTTSMLTNVPKSDTEKFLHVMIGGTVEEYPTVDTELDYWMDKCVNYMNTNGNIGE